MAESDMLRSRLEQQEREHSPSRVPAAEGQSPTGEGRAGGDRSGLAAELEDVDDARVQQLEDKVCQSYQKMWKHHHTSVASKLLPFCSGEVPLHSRASFADKL